MPATLVSSRLRGGFPSRGFAREALPSTRRRSFEQRHDNLRSLMKAFERGFEDYPTLFDKRMNLCGFTTRLCTHSS
jgi:hypothetical protein